MRNVRTIYSPGVAMVYIIENLKTGESITAATCGIKDTDYAPWRSPKGTIPGNEFFKMKIGNKKDGFKSVTFLNSIKHSKCISDDGEWLFTGKRPNGGQLRRLDEYIEPTTKKVEYQTVPTNIAKAVVQKVLDNELTVTLSDLQATVVTEEFVDLDEMNKILN